MDKKPTDKKPVLNAAMRQGLQDQVELLHKAINAAFELPQPEITKLQINPPMDTSDEELIRYVKDVRGNAKSVGQELSRFWDRAKILVNKLQVELDNTDNLLEDV